MKKVTPVFGPQELFDGLPESCVIAVNYHCSNAVVGYSALSLAFKQVAEYCMLRNVTKVPEIAMRRIEEVPEPKRWTWEDKKARRLPEVGVEFQTSIGVRKCVITEGKFIFTVNDDAVEVFTIDSAMPLETPEEKAERLRVEWHRKALDKYLSDENLEPDAMMFVHDALLSGALSVPTKGCE